MKKIFQLFILFVTAAVIYGCQDEIDQEGLTDFAPGIISITPGENTTVVQSEFNAIKGYFADGASSPLSSATLILTDVNSEELINITESLSGTEDSLIVDTTTFDFGSLELGVYTLKVTITDSENQSTVAEYTFEISDQAFPAIQKEMYIAGAFNAWGADPLELVAANTWQIKEIDLAGGEWKLKNTVDWTDEDWGDGECDGALEVFGANIACGFTGLVNVTFYDDDLTYEVEPAVAIASNLSSLYLHATFNNFEGGDYAFNLVDDNIWEIAEVQLAAGDAIRFSEGEFSDGTVYGDNEPDSIADSPGANIIMPDDLTSAYYKITFNDATLEYSIEFVKFPSIGLIGDATPGGWDADTDLIDNGDGTFTGLMPLTVGEAKFRADDDWATNWGAADFPTGTGTQDGANIAVNEAGLYLINFDPETGDYSFESVTIGVVGDATPGGWDNDTDLSMDGGDPSVWTALMTFTDGVAKFRAADDWTFNWGALDFPAGTAVQDGDNIPVTAGEYLVTFNVTTGEYTFEEI